jgi:FtsZ-binding cell division protein ZapB
MQLSYYQRERFLTTAKQIVQVLLPMDRFDFLETAEKAVGEKTASEITRLQEELTEAVEERNTLQKENDDLEAKNEALETTCSELRDKLEDKPKGKGKSK